jgi:hypothetical protein
MRFSVDNAISPDLALDIRSTVGKLQFGDRRLRSLVGFVQSHISVSLDPPSYVKVERKSTGHDWHLDTGSENHMPWCAYSAQILLSRPYEFAGGGFYFHGEDGPVDSFCRLLIYDSVPENEHRVLPHSGDRRVLLMFFAHG